MTRSELGRSALFGGLALLSGALVFWTALRSSGSDWFYTETQADIIYTGVRSFGEFPFFSFVLNGGAYLLQDPQTTLFSPAVPLILLAGPTVGLRLMEGLWGAMGVFAFVLWMRKHVSLEAALLGAVASVTGLGVLWRVAVGNDMFLWHLGLPLLLWATDKVLSERNVRSAPILGLVLGVMLLGPTFHSFTYLFLPAVPLYVLFQLAIKRPKLPELATTLALYLAACGLALLILSPKLVCWLKFPMSRPVADAGVIGVGSALRGLVDYSLAKHALVGTTSMVGSKIVNSKWGLEECAAALPPIASLLALGGLFSSIRARAQRPFAIFALLLIGIALALTCSWPIWSTFRSLTGGNFRAAPRFLGLAAFGMAILVALGSEAIFARWKRAAFPATVALAGLMLASGVWWTLTAARFGGDSPTDCVHPNPINPFRTASKERAAAARLHTFTGLTNLGTVVRPILDGVGYPRGLVVVGNKSRPKRWKPKGPQQTLALVVSGIDPNDVSVSHVGIDLKDVPPQAKIRLRALLPSFGRTTTTWPPNAAIEVRQNRDFLSIKNNGATPVSRVRLRADLPISGMWFVLSIVSVLGALLALLVSSPFFRGFLAQRSWAKASSHGS
jgi:hypothetical protein